MSLPVIVHADVEELIAAYLPAPLATDFPGVKVSNEKSDATYSVWVRRDGGQRLDVVRESATVGINVFGPSWHDASALARRVIALLNAWPNGQPVVKVSTSGPSRIADATPRLYLTADVWQRGTPLS